MASLSRQYLFYGLHAYTLSEKIDPSALGEDKAKQEVVPVTEIDEWLELVIIYSAVRARRFPGRPSVNILHEIC